MGKDGILKLNQLGNVGDANIDPQVEFVNNPLLDGENSFKSEKKKIKFVCISGVPCIMHIDHIATHAELGTAHCNMDPC